MSGIPRIHHVVVGAADRRRRFIEEDGLFRNFLTRLLGVIGIVEANGDEIVRAGDGRPETCVMRRFGQRLEINVAELSEGDGREIFTGKVGNDLG